MIGRGYYYHIQFGIIRILTKLKIHLGKCFKNYHTKEY